jgi:hypothetical protein
MSETKFTPGPWEYRKAGKVNLSGEVPEGFSSEYPDHIVKIDRDEQGRRRTAFVATCESATLPNEANARLIAAAPELLSALKAIVRLYEMPHGEAGQESPGQYHRMAKDAIAKAEGRE